MASKLSLGEKTCSNDVHILVVLTGAHPAPDVIVVSDFVMSLLTNRVIVRYFYQFIHVNRILTVVFHLILVYSLAIRCCSVQGISMRIVATAVSFQPRQSFASESTQCTQVWYSSFVHMVSKYMSQCVPTFETNVATVLQICNASVRCWLS